MKFSIGNPLSGTSGKPDNNNGAVCKNCKQKVLALKTDPKTKKLICPACGQEWKQ